MRSFVSIAVVGSIAVAVAVALAKQPPPVIRNLGPYAPTPPPSPGAADKIRLVTSFTLRNSPEGQSITSFEVTDLTRSKDKVTAAGKKKETTHKIIASEIYSLAQGKKDLGPLREQIMRKVRDLEVDLLEFAQRVGPPKERAKITDQPAPRLR
jgi:hypothetical protein